MIKELGLFLHLNMWLHVANIPRVNLAFQISILIWKLSGGEIVSNFYYIW